MNGNKRCCAVIVTYNIGEELSKCFYSILNQVNKIVIVDNGSDKKTIEYLNKLDKKYDIEVIYNLENLGIATALNQGIKYAKSQEYEWILTMDNDSEATKNMVDVMLKTYATVKDKDIVSIFPKYIEKGINANTENIVSEYDGEYSIIGSEITSGNLIKLAVFDEIGLFDEKLFIDRVDHEICFRLTKYKKKMIKVEGAKLLHQLGRTVEKKIVFKKIEATNHSPVRRYYITRNRMYLWDKYSDIENEIKLDKKNFRREIVKILMLEKEKTLKMKMIWKGYRDYKKECFGEFKRK